MAIDKINGIVDVKKTKKTAEVHPPAVYAWDAPIPADAQTASLYRIGEWVAANGIDAPGLYRAGRDLLLRKPPVLRDGETLQPCASETPVNTATRVVLALGDSVFAIQGPPGSGKTYTGALMVSELVKRGGKIGITAFAHKAIHNFLEKLQVEVGGFNQGIRCVRKIIGRRPHRGTRRR